MGASEKVLTIDGFFALNILSFDFGARKPNEVFGSVAGDVFPNRGHTITVYAYVVF